MSDSKTTNPTLSRRQLAGLAAITTALGFALGTAPAGAFESWSGVRQHKLNRAAKAGRSSEKHKINRRNTKEKREYLKLNRS